MRKKICISLCLTSIVLFVFSLNFQAQTSSNQTWTKEAATQWLNSKTWKGDMTLSVYKAVDAVEFAKQYHKNKIRWDKAFSYLKNQKLDTVSTGKYYLMGDTVYISVTYNKPKAFEATKWEAHKQYIDIQYVAKGMEKIGVAPVSKGSVAEPYNETKDVGFYSLPDADSKYYLAQPDTFLIFFTTEAHEPNIKIYGCDIDKKIVIKVLAD